MSEAIKGKRKINLYSKRVELIYHNALWFVGLVGFVFLGLNYMVFIGMYASLNPCAEGDQVCIDGRDASWSVIRATPIYLVFVLALFVFWTLRGPKPSVEVKA